MSLKAQLSGLLIVFVVVVGVDVGIVLNQEVFFDPTQGITLMVLRLIGLSCSFLALFGILLFYFARTRQRAE